MDREELREVWSENKDRPAFVREHREEIHEYTDTNDPVPDGSLHEVRQWLDRFKSTVTRQLGENAKSEDTEGVNNANE